MESCFLKWQRKVTLSKEAHVFIDLLLIYICVTFFEGISAEIVIINTFKKTDQPGSFEILTVNLDARIPSKAIACAFRCVDDPNCVAYDSEETTTCNLMSISDGTSSASQPAFVKAYGKKKH